MECPHCTVTIHDDSKVLGSSRDIEGIWNITYQTCPSCRRVILALFKTMQVSSVNQPLGDPKEFKYYVYPKSISRKPVSSLVPAEFSEDYKEACLVLSDSPKASAALGRRCLQNLLRNKVGIRPSDLANEIEEAINNKHFPQYISEQLNLIRVLGNFAAHPMKSTNTGVIIPVDFPESEFTLDVLELLFDFLFVASDKAKSMKDTLNKKLQKAGKPLLP